MAKLRTKRYGVFDVVAQPHPAGIYRSIFETAVGSGVKYWGDYFAAITPISEERNDVFTGRIAVWMAVDPDSNVVSLADFSEEPLSSSDEVIIPQSVGLNSRIFQFGFNTKNHRLYLELNNDDGGRISARRAEAALQQTLSRAAKDLCDELRVQIIPESDSVEKILNIPRLTSLEVHLFRPNPDDQEDDANQLLAGELEDQNVKEAVKILKKAPGASTIVLNARNKALALAGAFSGLVKGKGKDADGNSVSASTKDYPMEIVREAANDTEAGGVRSVAE